MRLLDMRLETPVRRLLLGALVVLGLTGCEQIIEVPEPAHTPSLAVRYTLGTTPVDSAWNFYQSYRQLYVSASKRLFDQSLLGGQRNATARLYDASGNVVEEFRAGKPYFSFINDSAGYYLPTRGFVGQPGQTYRLRVEAPGYPAVESRLTMPGNAPTIISATFTPRTNNGGIGGRAGTLNVSIQDDGATTDYYVATARFVDLLGQPVRSGQVLRDNSDDGSDTDFQGGQFMLSEPGGNGDLYPFADTDVNGKAFTLKADLIVYAYDPNSGQDLPGQLEVTVSRCTRDTYEFWLSRRRYFDTQGNPFAEPAPLRSNIDGGFGIFGGVTDGSVRVPLP